MLGSVSASFINKFNVFLETSLECVQVRMRYDFEVCQGSIYSMRFITYNTETLSVKCNILNIVYV